MLPIAAVLHLLNPLVAGNRFIAALRLQMKTAFHLLLALFIAAAAYIGTLLLLITVYPSHLPEANLVYGVGVAAASLLGLRVLTLMAPSVLGRLGLDLAAMLAALLPLALFVEHAVAGDPRIVGYLWYLIGSLIGGMTAIRWLAPHDAAPIGTHRPRPVSHARPAV